MLITKNSIKEELDKTEKRIKANTREKTRYPEGRIRALPRSAKIEYMHITKDDDGREIRRGITKNTKLINMLARKEYLTKENIVLAKNLIVLQNALDNFEDDIETSALKLMKGNFKLIPNEKFLNAPLRTKHLQTQNTITTQELINIWNSDERHLLRNPEIQQEWEKSGYEKSEYMPEELKHTTELGFKVRSKSEALLCGIIKKLKRPLHYEEIIRINGFTFIPDFTVLDKNGKVVYIEHFGRTFDPEYMAKRRTKLEQYEKAGIVPWNNFIATYEDENGNIDTLVIEAELRAKLLHV